MIPYLYTANYHSASEGVPLVRPLYYAHNEPEAYLYKNEYLFGDSLLVHPVTTPMAVITSYSIHYTKLYDFPSLITNTLF